MLVLDKVNGAKSDTGDVLSVTLLGVTQPGERGEEGDEDWSAPPQAPYTERWRKQPPFNERSADISRKDVVLEGKNAPGSTPKGTSHSGRSRKLAVRCSACIGSTRAYVKSITHLMCANPKTVGGRTQRSIGKKVVRSSTLNEMLRKVHRDEEATGKEVLVRLQEGDAEQSEGRSEAQHAIVSIGG